MALVQVRDDGVLDQEGNNEDRKGGRFKRYLGGNQCYTEATKSSVIRVLKMTQKNFKISQL